MNSRLRERGENWWNIFCNKKCTEWEPENKLSSHPFRDGTYSVRQKMERYPPLIADYETFMPLRAKDILSHGVTKWFIEPGGFSKYHKRKTSNKEIAGNVYTKMDKVVE